MEVIFSTVKNRIRVCFFHCDWHDERIERKLRTFWKTGWNLVILLNILLFLFCKVSEKSKNTEVEMSTRIQTRQIGQIDLFWSRTDMLYCYTLDNGRQRTFPDMKPLFWLHISNLLLLLKTAEWPKMCPSVNTHVIPSSLPGWIDFY